MGDVDILTATSFKLLCDYKIIGTFQLNSIKELVGYNEHFQAQKVVVDSFSIYVNIFYLHCLLEGFWDFVFIMMFCIM
jgi:hypothetical protein